MKANFKKLEFNVSDGGKVYVYDHMPEVGKKFYIKYVKGVREDRILKEFILGGYFTSTFTEDDRELIELINQICKEHNFDVEVVTEKEFLENFGK